MPKTAIKVEHLSKKYNLGIINNGTLYRDIQTWIALKRGKEDPHSKIGVNKYQADKDHFWALKDISFEISQGDRVGIIGKNGAGKSTLLKLLSRITSPTEGTIKIKGKIASLLEVGTGFHGELTGRENIYLNGAILGMKKRRIDQKLDDIISFSGIEHHIDTPVKRYSSGMYVRLAFAVAAHLDSDILIADEVLAVGDAEFQKKALGKMQDLSAGEGRTVLFVSHNMGSVERLCNTGMIIQNGSLIHKSDDIKTTIRKYQFDSQEDSAIIKSEWINNENEFDNEWFRPLKFYITDDKMNLVNEPVSFDNDLYVNIEGIIKESNPALKIGYALYNEDNILIYLSYQTDTSQDNWPELKPGHFHLRSSIPKKYLNQSAYTLKFSANLHRHRALCSHNNYSPSISFSINSGPVNSPYLRGKNTGVLCPILPWEIVK